MNKRMREIKQEIAELKETATKAVNEKRFDDADKALKQINDLSRKYDLENKLFEMGKDETPKGKAQEPTAQKKLNGFKVLAKAVNTGMKSLDDNEKALVTGGTNGEDNLVPEDVRLEINELRKSYISARDIVTVIPTVALKGSFNYESGTPAGLTNFDDGAAITEDTEVSFVKKSFVISLYGKLIPVSRILEGAEQSQLMNYLNRWFIKNAILSENTKIFTVLKTGKTAKSINGWKALKESINTDLDPSALFDGVIVTNQTGFTILDEEEDNEGRPVLQPNPANPTEKLFQGLPIKVYPDSQLANISTGKAPIFYGNTKAGANFMDYKELEFGVSTEYLFNKNQDCLRVVEGFDVIGTDNADTTYMYGTFEATPSSNG